MKLGISTRLFLMILVACALVLAASGMIGRALFERSFMGYLNEQGEERMREVLPRLQAAWRQHGDWDFVRDDPEAWFRLLRPERPRDDDVPRTPSVSDQTGAVPRLALLDADGAHLAGNPAAGSDGIRLPVEIDGRTVGWLAMVPFQKAIAAGDVRFYRAQVRGWWANGAASVIVAALLAWLFSRMLMRRVRSLTDTVHRLAAGDYGHRVERPGDDALGRLAADVNRLADTLEHTERNRRDFMADISHELRTPLAVLRAELEAIQDGIRPMTPTTLGPLQGEVQQLGKLIDDLHELSVTQAGEVSCRFATLDLGEVLQSAVVGMRGRFADAGLALHESLADAPLRVEGDERRLQQLFANLLENALRYTDRGGEVAVRARRHGERVQVEIEDSAPGVAEDQRERLFERFYRVDASRNRASGGSGLGLAICRNIVQAHAGTIRAEASALGGLRIVVSLPASP
ncbi:MAG: sensor histidine kinase efflux regulator BaeS [Pseudoxanthomonas sp.]